MGSRPPTSNIGGEFSKLGIHRRMGLVFHSAVILDDAVSERSQLGSAARCAAVLGLDDRLVEHTVQFVDQESAAPVRHPHRSPGCRDRPMVAHGFEQSNLAVSNCPT